MDDIQLQDSFKKVMQESTPFFQQFTSNPRPASSVSSAPQDTARSVDLPLSCTSSLSQSRASPLADSPEHARHSATASVHSATSRRTQGSGAGTAAGDATDRSVGMMGSPSQSPYNDERVSAEGLERLQVG